MLKKMYKCIGKHNFQGLHKFEPLWKWKGWKLVKHQTRSLILDKAIWKKKKNINPLFQKKKKIKIYKNIKV